MDAGGPGLLWAALSLDRWASIRKLAGQGSMSDPVSGFPSWFLFQEPTLLSSMTGITCTFKQKLSSPKLLLVEGFVTLTERKLEP